LSNTPQPEEKRRATGPCKRIAEEGEKKRNQFCPHGNTNGEKQRSDRVISKRESGKRKRSTDLEPQQKKWESKVRRLRRARGDRVKRYDKKAAKTEAGLEQQLRLQRGLGKAVQNHDLVPVRNKVAQGDSTGTRGPGRKNKKSRVSADGPEVVKARKKVQQPGKARGK